MSQPQMNSKDTFNLTPSKLNKLLEVLKDHGVKSFSTSSFSLTFQENYDTVVSPAIQNYVAHEEPVSNPTSPEELDEQIRTLGYVHLG